MRLRPSPPPDPGPGPDTTGAGPPPAAPAPTSAPVTPVPPVVAAAPVAGRRPLDSRNAEWARAATRRLAGMAISPNEISAFSMVAAVLAGLCLGMAGPTGGFVQVVALLLGAVLVQVRLLCNLFDGMLAIEAGRGGPTGAFWNEVPDRPADVFILVGLGYGAGMPALGWTAALLALFVAYLRAFGVSLGQPADYRGPMAKQHRMAAVTAAAVIAALLAAVIPAGAVLQAALWIIVAGGVATAVRRSIRIREILRRD